MDNVPFTIEEENLICIYHKYDRRRTIAAISDALPDMDADMRPLAEQTIHKLHNMIMYNKLRKLKRAKKKT